MISIKKHLAILLCIFGCFILLKQVQAVETVRYVKILLHNCGVFDQNSQIEFKSGTTCEASFTIPMPIGPQNSLEVHLYHHQRNRKTDLTLHAEHQGVIDRRSQGGWKGVYDTHMNCVFHWAYFCVRRRQAESAVLKFASPVPQPQQSTTSLPEKKSKVEETSVLFES